MKQALVRDWMSPDVVTVTPQTPLPDASQRMLTYTIRRLPVVENGRLVGIVTYGDLREAKPSAATSLNLWEMNYLLNKVTVGEMMTPNPITVLPDDDISKAAQLMLHNMISGLPVVDEKDQLVGIITESDIFRLVVHDWGHAEEDHPEAYAHYG